MKVLFVCKGNWFRSQIAEALYNKLTNSDDASSAGTYVGALDEPEGQSIVDLLPASFFDAMESHGLFMRDKKTRRLTPEIMKGADVVVSMAQEPFIPDYLRNDPKVIWWDVADDEGVEKTYRKIESFMQKYIVS